MTDLRAHWDEFEARIGSAAALCILTDFDGTLVPLAERPEAVSLPASARRTLESLASRPRVTVGVISGRSLGDVASRVGLPAIWYVGNHGFEIRNPSGDEVRFYEAEDVSYMSEVRREIAFQTAAIPGILLEEKGPILAVHYRRVDPDQVRNVERAFYEVVTPRHRRLMVTRGHAVLEARVRQNCNKGMAARWIRRRSFPGALTIYFGDDLTDRDVFRELAGVGLSVEVAAVGSGLAPYGVPDSGAVIEVLGKIDTALARRAGGKGKRPGSSPRSK